LSHWRWRPGQLSSRRVRRSSCSVTKWVWCCSLLAACTSSTCSYSLEFAETRKGSGMRCHLRRSRPMLGSTWLYRD